MEISKDNYGNFLIKPEKFELKKANSAIYIHKAVTSFLLC